MKSFTQFKIEVGVPNITLLQGKGRKYAQVRDQQLVVSSKCDLKKPLFVIPLTEAIDKEQPISQENSQVIPGVHLLINASTVTEAETI